MGLALAMSALFLPLPCPGQEAGFVGEAAMADSIAAGCAMASDTVPASVIAVPDTIEAGAVLGVDSLGTADALAESVDSIMAAVDSLAMAQAAPADSLPRKGKRDWNTWRPNAKRAMWLALVIPGAGQVYNRKFWKLPIVYGGFLGCIYALRWNGMMHSDYSQAYMDLMDNDPSTESYNQFLHLGATITDANKSRYESLFQKRKDYYRKYRDLSIFALIGVYALSVIDAYVDASLSEFDISRDLSLKVEPAIINNSAAYNPLRASSLGLQCYLNF